MGLEGGGGGLYYIFRVEFERFHCPIKRSTYINLPLSNCETAKNNEDMSYTSLRCHVDCATRERREKERIGENQTMGEHDFSFKTSKRTKISILGLRFTPLTGKKKYRREKSSIIIKYLIASFSEMLHSISSLNKICISQTNSDYKYVDKNYLIFSYTYIHSFATSKIF